MKVPAIDLEKLEKFKEKNFQERLDFIKKYAEWVKRSSNKEWSSQHKKIADS